jgi:glutaredoxin
VKALLSREDVPFTARNVDEDDRAYDDLIARGWRTIPVTVFDDRTIVKGFDEPALMSAIAGLRGHAGEKGPPD